MINSSDFHSVPCYQGPSTNRNIKCTHDLIYIHIIDVKNIYIIYYIRIDDENILFIIIIYFMQININVKPFKLLKKKNKKKLKDKSFEINYILRKIRTEIYPAVVTYIKQIS